MRQELQQERKQSETEGKLQHQGRKEPASRTEACKFQKRDKEECMSILGVSEVQWKAHGEIRSGDYTI